jgi:hypothetical protein
VKPRFDSEPPTYRMTPTARAAKLVRDWKESPPAYQRMLERLAHKGSKLPKEPQPIKAMRVKR